MRKRRNRTSATVSPCPARWARSPEPPGNRWHGTRFYPRAPLVGNLLAHPQCAELRELGPGVSGSRATYATGSFETLPVVEESARAELFGRPTEPTDRASQHRDQPIDRDHQNVLIKPLDAACANQADHWHRAASTPPPTPPRRPCRLVAHPREMTTVVRPRFRLNREPDAGRRDRQRVDVPSSSPRQRVPQPPPLRLKRRKHTPDLVLGASSHAAALGERQPMPSVEPERNRSQQQHRQPHIGAPAPAMTSPSRAAAALSAPGRGRRATAGGTAGGRPSSRCDLPDCGTGDHRLSPTKPTPGMSPIVAPAPDGSASRPPERSCGGELVRDWAPDPGARRASLSLSCAHPREFVRLAPRNPRQYPLGSPAFCPRLGRRRGSLHALGKCGFAGRKQPSARSSAG